MTYWFTKTPHGICCDLGIAVDPRRAKELSDLFDGNINGWYYLSAATPDGTDEAAKWILGGLAAKLNELRVGFDQANRILPADYLSAFVSYLQNKRFDRSFSKEVFAELIKTGERFVEIQLSDQMTAAEVQEWFPIKRLSGQEIMDSIICMPKFKASSADEIDDMIESVIASNPDAAAKVSLQPKLLQWFVGQVMKASQGKASAPVVLEKLKQRFVG
jgi:Asp-tRNA(Asn)/Glu-tRNA(Gln) amidotransferase B subunit